MLAAGDLEQVTPSTENATRLLAEAQRHLSSAALEADADPAGGYDLLYTAARKSMAAVLAVQGLRATSKGGHLAVQEAVAAQLPEPKRCSPRLNCQTPHSRTVSRSSRSQIVTSGSGA